MTDRGCKAFAFNIASIPPGCAPQLALYLPPTQYQDTVSPVPPLPMAYFLQLPHLPNQQPPTSVLLQFDLQPKPSGRFDLPVPAPHGPPPSCHVTPSWAYSKPPPPLACTCSRPTTKTSSSREREKLTPSAANYQAYESSTWAVDLTSWLV